MHAEPVWVAQKGSQTLFLQSDKVFEVLLHGNRGGGKQLEVAEPVLTARGWVAAGEVSEEDKLVAPDGTYTDIIEIHRGSGRPFYRITTEGGASVVACGEHRWSVYDGDNGCKDGWIVRDTDWIKQRVDKGRYIYLPLMDAPAPGKKWEGVDPYIAGLVLGDGSLVGSNVVVYTVDQHTKDYLKAAGWKEYDYDSQNTTMMACPKPQGVLWQSLLGRVSRGDKRVPKALLEADPEARLAVLQGLMDSDGSVEKGKGTSSSPGGQCSFAQGHLGLCEDVQYLVRSLGGKARIREKKQRVTNRGGTLPEYDVTITHANKFNPFRMPRKAALVRKQKGTRDKIVSIEPVGPREGVCFAVTHPSHLYVCKDFMVTHNTDTLIMAFCKHVGLGYGDFWQGIIFRQTYKQLQDVVKKSKRWIPRIFPGAEYNESSMTWRFPEGEQLRFAHMRVPSDYDNYHGHEYCMAEGTLIRTPSGPVPIQSLKKGSLVDTPAGPKRVKAVFRTSSKRCVRARVYSSDGHLIGEQVQSEDHRLLTSEGWQSASSGPRFQSALLFSEEKHQTATYRKSKNVTGQETLCGFSYWRREETIGGTCRNSRQSGEAGLSSGPRIAEPLAPAPKMGVQGSQGIPTPLRVISRSFSPSQARKAEMSTGLSGLELLEVLLAQHLPEFSSGETSGALFEMRTTEDFPVGYPIGRGSCGELARTGTGNGLEHSRPQSCVQGPTQNEPLGGGVTAPRHNRPDPFSFPHPYSGETVETSRAFDLGRVEYEPWDPVPLWDMEVEDVNCYIAHDTGTVNKNCFIGWEELTTWATSECYTRMISCCRSSGPKDMPRMIRSTTNPYGPGFTWVKKRFRLPEASFQIWREEEIDENTGRATLSKPRLAIQSRLSENKILLATDPEYMETIRTSARNEQELRAWLFGSWDIVAGGMFSDVWEPKVHVIKPFKIPPTWRIDRAMDWGSAKPFSVGWYAESDGTPVKDPVTGRLYGEVRGDLFRIGEWYGTTGKPDEGLGLTGSELGEGIRDRELDFPVQGNIHKRVLAGPADHNIFGDGTRGARSVSIAQEMRRSGIRFDKALKGPGSRKAGWQVCRDYLANAMPTQAGVSRAGPGLYIFDNCRYFIDLVPSLSRDDADPDDIDSSVEDHIADEMRYRLRRVRRIMKNGEF